MPPAGTRFLVCCCLAKSHYKGITHFFVFVFFVVVVVVVLF